MLDSVHTPFPECIQTLTERKSLDRFVVLMVDISLDPGFAEFYDWTLKNNVPVIVLSSGMEPIIRALLAKFIGPKANSIPIISNNVEISPDKSWKIIYRDESRTPPHLVRR
jgi:2-hydroxy-3-keto-5-methylthiopentenyl-1-phosphate phosphatase